MFKPRWGPQSLVILLVFSWALYPWAISWIFPNAVRIVFGAGLLLVLPMALFSHWEANPIFVTREDKLLIYCGSAYVFCLFLASFVFNSAGNLDLFIRYSLKIFFFIILLRYLNNRIIQSSFNIYAHVVFIFSILSLVCIAGMYLDLMSYYKTVISPGLGDLRQINWTWSGFDGNALVFAHVPNFFRLQSFAVEPGSFALAALPALYWFLFVRENFMKASVVFLGIIASWSLGAFLAISACAVLLLFNRRLSKKYLIFLATGILFFGSSHSTLSRLFSPPAAQSLPSDPAQKSEQMVTNTKKEESKLEPGVSIEAGERTASLRQRIFELVEVGVFLQEHALGTGIGKARALLQSSLSVGYANVFAEAGLLGGISYLAFFALLLRQCFRSICQTTDAVRITLGLSVFTCIFFGLQREQPDGTYWHFWLCAAFICWDNRFRRSLN